jgi:hypothetical protein
VIIRLWKIILVIDLSLRCSYKKEIKKIIGMINFRKNPKKEQRKKVKSRFKTIALLLFRGIKWGKAAANLGI